MDKQLIYAIDLEAPRLLPGSGGYKVVQIELTIILTGVDISEAHIEDVLDVSIEKNGTISVRRTDYSESMRVFITSYVLVCQYHLPADYSTTFNHHILISGKRLRKLMKTWKMDSYRYKPRLERIHDMSSKEIICPVYPPRNTRFFAKTCCQ